MGRPCASVKLMGDGALVEFSSVVDAVASAIEIQEALENDGAISDAGHQIKLQIGINLGDILIDGSDIEGDGVNAAARLQEIAKPG